jgi:uncharacterized tellurite resistance protein B-like protein
LKNAQTSFESQISGRDRHIQELIANLENLNKEAADLRQTQTISANLQEEVFRREEFIQRVVSDIEQLKQENNTLKGTIDQLRLRTVL